MQRPNPKIPVFQSIFCLSHKACLQYYFYIKQNNNFMQNAARLLSSNDKQLLHKDVPEWVLLQPNESEKIRKPFPLWYSFTFSVLPSLPW